MVTTEKYLKRLRKHQKTLLPGYLDGFMYSRRMNNKKCDSFNSIIEIMAEFQVNDC